MGMNYGVNNRLGKISREESFLILSKAHLSGIETLDTAEAYGDAHDVIGHFHRAQHDIKFKIITKLPHSIRDNEINIRVEEYLKRLGVDFLDVLMFHSFESYTKNQNAMDTNSVVGVLIKAVQELSEELNRIKKWQDQQKP